MSMFYLKAGHIVYIILFMQGILSDILKCLGDNKKLMRECTLSTLDSWLAAAHLDKMVCIHMLMLQEFFSLESCCMHC